MKILVVSSCTGEKKIEMKTVTCETIDKYGLEGLKNQGLPQLPAWQMYTGKQHLAIVKSVKELRRKKFGVDWYILSAGFGLIHENEMIAPYECTFNKMKKSEIIERGKKLGINVSFKKLLDENYDVLFSLLGSNYLLPLDLNLIPETTNAYILCAENQEIPQKNHIHKVVSSIEQARKLKTILINVKGYQFLSFAKKVKEDYDLKRVDLVLEELTNL